MTNVESAGRWTLLRQVSGATPKENGQTRGASEEAIEAFARALLRRYGVVFRRLLDRESMRVGWYELGRVYRRLEARGEIRGGRFVNGVSGEQFAVPEAIGLMRSIRKGGPTGECAVISAADPLNLHGILTSGTRIASIPANRILLRDGVPAAALVAGEIQDLSPASGLTPTEIEHALKVGSMAAELRLYYG